MLQVMFLNEKAPFYKFLRSGKDLSVVKYKTPETAQIAEVKQSLHKYNGNLGLFYSPDLQQVQSLNNL